jgi:hypothetical protein
VEQSRLHVLEPTFFANGAEVGGGRGPGASPGAPNPPPGPPRRLAAQGGKGEGGLCTALKLALRQSKLYRFETPEPRSLNGKPPIEVLVPDTSRGGRAGRKFGLSTAGTWIAKMRKTALQ